MSYVYIWVSIRQQLRTLAGASDRVNLDAFMLRPAPPVLQRVELAAEIRFAPVETCRASPAAALWRHV
jgi:hypothetical protein